MDIERSETGRSGLKAGQLGGAFGVCTWDFGGAFGARDFFPVGMACRREVALAGHSDNLKLKPVKGSI